MNGLVLDVSKKVKYIGFLLYTYIFSMFFQSGSVQAAIMREGFLFQVTRLFLLLIPAFIVCQLGFTKRQVKFLFRSLLVGIFLLCVNFFLFPEGALQLLYKIIVFIEAGILISTLYRKGVIIDYYIYRAILMLATVTLFMYILVEIIKVPLPYTYLYNGNSYQYKNYFDIFQTYHYGMAIPRLSGIFWEPGVYQIFLNISLFIFITQPKRKKVKEMLIIVANIIFCQSTAGYCITTILILYLIMKSNKFKSNSKKIISIISVFLGLLISSYFVYNKQVATDYEGGSFALRVLDILNGFSIWVSHPVFGVGFGNEMPFVSLDAYGRGSSNGLISWLYMMGLVGMILFLYPYIRNIVKASGKTRLVYWIWFIIVLIFNLVEPVYNLSIMAFLLALEYWRPYLYINKKAYENGKIRQFI